MVAIFWYNLSFFISPYALLHLLGFIHLHFQREGDTSRSYERTLDLLSISIAVEASGKHRRRKYGSTSFARAH